MLKEGCKVKAVHTIRVNKDNVPDVPTGTEGTVDRILNSMLKGLLYIIKFDSYEDRLFCVYGDEITEVFNNETKN